MSDLLPVTQADRDAVQAFHRTMAARLMSDIASERPTLGEDEGDAGTLVQAFARHRLAAIDSRAGDAGEVSRIVDRFDAYCLAIADRPTSAKRDEWIGELSILRRMMFGPATPAPAVDAWEGECTCQNYPTHCANDCPLHGLDEPTALPEQFAENAKTAVDAVPAGEDLAEQAHAAVRQGNYRIAYLKMCEAYGNLASRIGGEIA